MKINRAGGPKGIVEAKEITKGECYQIRCGFHSSTNVYMRTDGCGPFALKHRFQSAELPTALPSILAVCLWDGERVEISEDTQVIPIEVTVEVH